VGYILSENLHNMSLDTARTLHSEISEIFTHWHATQEIVHGLRKNITGAANSMDLQSLAKVPEAIGAPFLELFQENLCQPLKDQLMKAEHRQTGRVKLSEFYKIALGGGWNFQESVTYLRQLGVLEEIDLKEPSVMIANYLVSPSNCIGSSTFYSVCCKDECVDLMGHLEQNIASHEAEPATIAALIEELPSSTVAAPRALSATSRRRLDEIALHHGGTVPLHGRLFTQWMHHAYPRECPYPHISGTIDPKLQEDFVEDTGSESWALEEEMLQYIQWSTNATRCNAVTVEDLSAWTDQEELLVGHGESLSEVARLPWDSTAQVKASMAIFAVAGSLAFALIQSMEVTSLEPRGPPQKFVI